MTAFGGGGGYWTRCQGGASQNGAGGQSVQWLKLNLHVQEQSTTADQRLGNWKGACAAAMAFWWAFRWWGLGSTAEFPLHAFPPSPEKKNACLFYLKHHSRFCFNIQVLVSTVIGPWPSPLCSSLGASHSASAGPGRVSNIPLRPPPPQDPLLYVLITPLLPHILGSWWLQV